MPIATPHASISGHSAGFSPEPVARHADAMRPSEGNLRTRFEAAAGERPHNRVPSKIDLSQLAIAIPAFQAERSIADVVIRSLRLKARVLVIDDGSTDRTQRVAEEAGAEVLRLPVNSGKGAALQAAFRKLFAEGHSAVVTVDADGQHLPEEIPRLLEVADGADLVLGTRSHLFGQMSKLRQASNRLSSRAISLVAGCPLGDIQTGFRLYSKSLVEHLGFPEPRFEAESAVVVRAARHGFRIISVPVALGFADGRSTSHYRPLIDSFRIAYAVARARFERR